LEPSLPAKKVAKQIPGNLEHGELPCKKEALVRYRDDLVAWGALLQFFTIRDLRLKGQVFPNVEKPGRLQSHFRMRSEFEVVGKNILGQESFRPTLAIDGEATLVNGIPTSIQ
jgi:hypothetical protein